MGSTTISDKPHIHSLSFIVYVSASTVVHHPTVTVGNIPNLEGCDELKGMRYGGYDGDWLLPRLPNVGITISICSIAFIWMETLHNLEFKSVLGCSTMICQLFIWRVLNQFSPLKARGSSLVPCSKEKEPLKNQMHLQKLTLQLLVNVFTAARWFGFRLDPQFTIT